MNQMNIFSFYRKTVGGGDGVWGSMVVLNDFIFKGRKKSIFNIPPSYYKPLSCIPIINVREL